MERADLSAQAPAEVLGRGIRTYKPRRTRPTQRAARALQQSTDVRVAASDDLLDMATLFGADVPVIMDIGFGDGVATAALAAADPGTGVLAVDVHTPGVGELLARIDDQHLTNIRVIEGDALAVLERMVAPGALAGVRTWFPDPWPKARHHKRRIVQPRVRDLVWSRLADGAFWHLATDWVDYAEQMESCLAEDSRWSGGPIARPDWRPVTRFEQRALRDGRRVTDLIYVRTPGA